MAGEIKLSGPDLATEGMPTNSFGGEVPAVGHYDGKPVVLVQNSSGIFAVGGKCTHYGAPLGDGFSADGQLRCPWHHAAFDLASGEAVGAPALNPIPVYETEVRAGSVFITGVRDAVFTTPSPRDNPESVVILGSGAAGAAAAEELRRYGYTGPVTLIGVEPPIDRPNVSKDYLAGTAPEEWMPLRSADFYQKKNIELIAGRRVTSIDPAGRAVVFEDGGEVPYSSLLLATGAEPRRLDVPGADLSHVHYLRTLEDSKDIISSLDGPSRVVVVGAGFIGLETAASLRHREVDVTVVAPEDVPLASIVGEDLGRFVEALHREHGVDFRLGRGVDSITAEEVRLDDGSSVPADLVIVGVGVVPRTDIAEAAGLDVDRGLVVDARLRTSDPNIWAAGDIASYPTPDGGRTRVEHWVHAQRQGQHAARSILGDPSPFNDPPFFWSQHYDVPINVTGLLAGWDRAEVSGDPAARDVLVAFRAQGVIKAVASIYRDRENLQAEQALATGDQETLESLLV